MLRQVPLDQTLDLVQAFGVTELLQLDGVEKGRQGIRQLQRAGGV